MSLVKKAGAWFLTLALLASVMPAGLMAYADGEDVTFTFSKVELYDESEHEIGDEITEAHPGDVIAVTLSATNNTSKAITLDGFTQHFSFDPQVLAVYEKDETDTDKDGDFWQYGYQALNGFTATAGAGVAGSGEATEGISNVNVGSSGVSIKKNKSLELVVFLFKVLPTATGETVTVSFAENDKNVYTFPGGATYATGDALSLTLQGGGEPTPTPYQITYPEASNGNSVTGKTEAQAEETVELTVTTATGYELDTLKANNQEVTKSADGKYAFTMPAENVTVTATFKATETPTPYQITYPDASNGNSVTGKAEAQADETVELTVTTATGYELDTLKANNQEVTKSADGKYAFTMPAENVTVTATFKETSQNPGNPENQDKDVTFTFSKVELYDESTHEIGDEITEAHPGDVIAVTLSAKNNTGSAITLDGFTQHFSFDPQVLAVYEKDETDTDKDGDFWQYGYQALNGFTATAGAGVAGSGEATEGISNVNVGSSGVSIKKNNSLDLIVVLYKVLPTATGETATLSFVENDKNVYTFQGDVTYATGDALSLTLQGGGEPTPTPYPVTVTFDSNDGTSEPQKVTVNKGEKVPKPEKDPVRDGFTFIGWFEDEYNSGEATKKVTFPYTADKDITFYAGWEENKPVPTEYDITYTKAQNGSVDGVKKSEADKEITLTVKPADGYELDTLTVDGETTKNITVKNNKFTMPAENVTVTATFKKTETASTKYKITYAKAQNGSVEGVKESEADKEITLTVKPADGYELDTLTVDGETTKNITVKNNKFTMPAENVTVTATFKKIGGSSSGDSSNSGPCYIATSVYGSYDTPEVWTLRRFRDDVLGQTWYGRLFIKAYYATSPTLVRWFGNVEWFQNFWRDTLDSLVSDLQEQGFESTPYEDKDW